ncbi:MAG: DUF1080 domain-containing protein [Bacteroidetes bacterium]|nr:DUF1080 domain-containing protein [Bacteroidota bacterium]
MMSATQKLFVPIFFLLATSATKANYFSPTVDPPKIIGRWDLTVMDGTKESPSWLEVTHSGYSTLVGRFVGAGGSARPISIVNFKDGKFNFSIPPQWEMGTNNIVVEGTLQDEKLTGTLTSANGKVYNFTGVRAPLLKRDKEVVFGDPVPLFNGKDLTGWHAQGTNNQWIAENGVLKSPKSGSNIMTDKTFDDFKLHVEFRYPPGSNSGVYLRGRYEVQIEDNKGMEPALDFVSAIYGFLMPSEIASKGAGEWETYDITLIGRMVTITMNGKTVINNQAIPGPTGGALNSKEGEPGPILFQGDHGPIEYRNITIAVPK